jgi:hypothetical protein
VITVPPVDGFRERKTVESNGGANSPNAIYRTLEGEAVRLVPAFVALAEDLAGDVSWKKLTCGDSGNTAIRGVEEIDGIWASVSLTASSADATMHLHVESPEVRGGLDGRPPDDLELEVDLRCPEDVAALGASAP